MAGRAVGDAWSKAHERERIRTEGSLTKIEAVESASRKVPMDRKHPPGVVAQPDIEPLPGPEIS